jgi:surface protein
MFWGCETFNQPLVLNTSSVENMSGMFSGCTAFNQPLAFDTRKVKSMETMFKDCTAFNQPLDLNTSSVEIMDSMFKDCKSFNQPLKWDTSKVKDMEYMFYGCQAFNQPLQTVTDYEKGIYWNVSSVTTMKGMFMYCDTFNQPLNTWNTEKVKDMSHLFSACENFNQPLDRWDTEMVKNMSNMFSACKKFNQRLDRWDTSNVLDMSYMFVGCETFNEPLDLWDTANVRTMSYMFYGCKAFNQCINTQFVPIKGRADECWVVSEVATMDHMFYGCETFNQPLDLWDTLGVTDMEYMFYGCKAFNQPLKEHRVNTVIPYLQDYFSKALWNVFNLEAIQGMFKGCTSFNQDLSNWRIRLDWQVMNSTFEPTFPRQFLPPHERRNVQENPRAIAYEVHVASSQIKFKELTELLKERTGSLDLNQPLSIYPKILDILSELKEYIQDKINKDDDLFLGAYIALMDDFEDIELPLKKMTDEEYREGFKRVLQKVIAKKKTNKLKLEIRLAKELIHEFVNKKNMKTEIKIILRNINLKDVADALILKEENNVYVDDLIRDAGYLETIAVKIQDHYLVQFSPEMREAFYYSLAYLKKQPVLFKKIYVDSYLRDCAIAYNGQEGLEAVSCVGGMFERLVLSLASACIAELAQNENSDYTTIVSLVKGDSELISFIKNHIQLWYKLHDTKKPLAFKKDVTLEQREADLKKYLMGEFKNEAMIDKIMADYSQGIGFEDDAFEDTNTTVQPAQVQVAQDDIQSAINSPNVVNEVDLNAPNEPRHILNRAEWKRKSKTRKNDQGLSLNRFLEKKTGATIPSGLNYPLFIRTKLLELVNDIQGKKNKDRLDIINHTNPYTIEIERIMEEDLNHLDYDRLPEHLKRSIFYVLEYLQQQPIAFKQEYIETFIAECKGTLKNMAKTIVTSLKKPCTTFKEKMDYGILLSFMGKTGTTFG